MPHKDKIILTRDVLFDEHIFFDRKSESLSSQLIAKMNTLITKIEISETEVTNKHILKEDEKIMETFFDLDEKSDNEIIVKFDKKKDFELVKVLEKALSYSTTSS